MGRSRRQFLREGGSLAASAGIYSLLPASLIGGACARRSGANDRIRVGLIGCRNMGYTNITQFIREPDVEVAAICDIDRQMLDRRAADLTTFAYEQQLPIPKPDLMEDFRRMLDRRDIDAVIISTPDHWHALMTIMACQAGKDVYVEKPMANSIFEAEKMVEAGRKYQRVIQVGQWQRSGSHWKSMVDFLQSDKLGHINRVDVWRYGGNSVPKVPDAPVPPGVNYDLWLGPAPLRPFNLNRFHYNFRWFWDYAGGKMTDWGVHLIDMAMWGLNIKHPRQISAVGGNLVFPDDDMETPDRLRVDYRFGDMVLSWVNDFGQEVNEYNMDHGLIFHGENGLLLANRNFWKVVPAERNGSPAIEPVEPQASDGADLQKHVRNFLDAVKSRNRDTACNAEVASAVARVAHMGNIAYRSGETLHWDGETGYFNEAAGNLLIRPQYREPWQLGE